MGQMVSPILVLWFCRSRFCVCFVMRHGVIFIFWVQMGWMCNDLVVFFFFFFSLIWVFGFGEILMGSRHGGGGVVIIGLFGC